MQDEMKGSSDNLQAESQPCPVCSLQPICISWGLDPEDLERLEGIVDHPETLGAGEHLFQFGDPLRAIYVVRNGVFKIYRNDSWGRERVLGFCLPGEVVGVDGIYPQRHISNAVALEACDICALPYAQLASRMEQSEGLRRQIFRLVSRGNVHSLSLTRGSSADQTVARFLLDVSHRYQTHGRPHLSFELPMSRQDMGDYLRISSDMICKVFERYAARDMIQVEGDRIRLMDMGKLTEAAGS